MCSSDLLESHLVYTANAVRILSLETPYALEQVCAMADFWYSPDDLAAAVSSGSFETVGMLVAPCSVNTMSCIAACLTKDLITRAADVTLKERRPLVLLIRESPLHAGHLRRMAELSDRGAIIAPPIPSFYHRPRTIDDLVDHSLGRALELLGIQLPGLKRWEGPR